MFVTPSVLWATDLFIQISVPLARLVTIVFNQSFSLKFAIVELFILYKFKLLQPEKLLEYNVVTVLGIVIPVKFEHFKKAFAFIVVTPSVIL